MPESADRLIKVFLLDDHEVVRQGLRALLESTGSIEVVGEAGTAAEAAARIPLTASGQSQDLRGTVSITASDVYSTTLLPPIIADLVRAANAITYANKDYPPALFFHGTSDTRVHHSTTMRMYEALEQAGVPVDLHLFAGEDHFFDREPRFYKATTDSIAIFISRYVPVREAVAAS